jgi:hypothetical protein
VSNFGGRKVVDVFISYPRSMRARVKPIKAKLDALGIDCFFDVENIDGGAEFPVVIDKAVKSARAVLACWSPVAFTRPWVMQECRVAHARNVLVPVAIEYFNALAVPTEFFGVNYLDLTNWNGNDDYEAWQLTLRTLGKLIRKELRTQRPPESILELQHVLPPPDPRLGLLSDLRTAWLAFPDKGSRGAVEGFLNRVRVSAPGSGLEFEVDYHLAEMNRADAQRRILKKKKQALALGGRPIVGRWHGHVRHCRMDGRISEHRRLWVCAPGGTFTALQCDLGTKDEGMWGFERGEFVLKLKNGVSYRGTIDGDVFSGSAKPPGTFEMRRSATK